MLLISLFLACGEHKHDVEGLADIAELEADIENGETLYISECSGCHGADAGGTGSAPDLVGEDLGHFVDAIQNGEGSMPAFPSLTNQDIADIYGYVQSL